MQVVELDEIPVDDLHRPYTGPHNRVRDDGARGTAAEHHDGRFVQSLLTRFTDLSQEDLLQIAVRLSSFSHGSYILYGVRTLFTGFLTVMSPLAAEQ